MTTTRQRGIPYVRVWTRAGGKLVLDGQIRGFQCQSSVNQPAGTFTLDIMPQQGTRAAAHAYNLPDLYRTIHPGDVVSIGFDRPGGIMLGIVDRVERQSSRVGPTTSESLRVTGRDFGKLLQDNIVHASLAVPDAPQFLADVEQVTGPEHVLLVSLPGTWGPIATAGATEVPGVFVAESIQTIVDWILRFGPSMTLPQLDAVAGGSGKPGEFIDTTASITTWNDARVWSEGLNDYNGSIYGFIKALLDPDFYEFYMTSIPVPGNDLPRIMLVIRPKPFDEATLDFAIVNEDPGITWESLRTTTEALDYHTITSAQVLSEEIGVSDTDVFSYYETTARFDLIGNEESRQAGLYYPLVDLWQLKRFGLRAYNARVTMMASDLTVIIEGTGEGISDLHSQVEEFRNRLLNWHRLADYFESGSMKVLGRDHFRPGDPVFVDYMLPHLGSSRGVKFYAPQVTHSWTFGQPYVCNLQLARGHNSSTIAAAKDLIAADAAPGNPQHFAST